LRELRRHQRESPKSPFVFVSERGAPLSAPGFSRMIERAGAAADFGIKAHAHMLRHGNAQSPRSAHYSCDASSISAKAKQESPSNGRRGLSHWH
jgi:integrase